MTAGDFFAAVDGLPFATLPEIIGHGSLVVVAPHPDDESLGCGALIAEACAMGMNVSLIVLSDGTGSHPNSKCYPPIELRHLREQETIEAVSGLGLKAENIQFWGLPDRHVPVSGAAFETARDALAACIAETAATAVCVTWRHDPHCDHTAAANLVSQVCVSLPSIRVLEYPVWGWALAPDTDVGTAPSGVRFNIDKHAALKRQAIAAHRSQTTDLIDDDPSAFRLSDDMISRFERQPEVFFHTKTELI